MEDGYYLGIGVSRIFFQIGDGRANNGDFTTPYTYVGSWHHVVAARDKNNSQFLLYLDGALVDKDSDTLGDVSNTFNVNIGKMTGGGGAFFKGLIDEVAIYKEALTAYQIREIYAQGWTRYLLAYK